MFCLLSLLLSNESSPRHPTRSNASRDKQQTKTANTRGALGCYRYPLCTSGTQKAEHTEPGRHDEILQKKYCKKNK